MVPGQIMNGIYKNSVSGKKKQRLSNRNDAASGNAAVVFGKLGRMQMWKADQSRVNADVVGM